MVTKRQMKWWQHKNKIAKKISKIFLPLGGENLIVTQVQLIKKLGN
jgi:hypothetical protein